MATSLNDNLPEVLKSVRTQPLFVMRLDVRKLLIVGATPGAYRRIGVVPGGSFEGERLSGEGGGRSHKLLFPDQSLIRDGGRAVRLDQSRCRGRHRPSHRRRT